jgi:ADP-heptose:LPS heptosyltransferase
MFFAFSKNKKIDRILLVSLTNVGDIVLTFPVFDTLREMFPSAKISVMVGPKGRTFFEGNPHVDELIVYDKRASWPERWKWFLKLRAHSFDLVVDLRNSFLPFLLKAKVVTFPALGRSKVHMREKHLNRLRSVLGVLQPQHHRYAIVPSKADERTIQHLLMGTRDFVLVAPGAADDRKRWSEEGFSAVITSLVKKKGQRVVVVGDMKDKAVVARILKDAPSGVFNLCGMTSLTELACVVDRCKGALVNDSGIMHVCSYYDVPTVSLFGPTDPFFYGPWSRENRVVRFNKGSPQDIVPEVIHALDEVLKR